MSTNASLVVDVDHDTNEKGPSTLLNKATTVPSESPCNTPNASATNKKCSFQTLANATLKDWGSIFLSPTDLVPYDSAMMRMRQDKMTEQHFYTAGSPRLKACVKYVYGIELYKESSSQERIDKIFKLVETKSSLERLVSIVFSHPKDTLIVKDSQAEAYVHMALTIDLFCNLEKRGLKKKNIRQGGGFPHKPFMFLQKGRNCFHPATVLFVSLYHQRLHNHLKILDAAQVARRYLFHNHKLLEDRVVRNKGGATAKFAENVTQCPPGPGHWTVVKCEEYEWVEDLHPQLCHCISVHKVGLVSGFKMHQPFRDAAQENAQYQKDRHLGYMFFDGEDPSITQGEWVSYEHEHTENTEFLKTMSKENRERVKKNSKDFQGMERDILEDLTKQNSRGIERLNELKETLRHELGTDYSQDFSNAFDGKKDLSSSQTSQTSGTHAMVLVAFEKNQISGEAVFLLCNPWQSMPLVGMSAAYLRACKAQIYFLNAAARSIDDNLNWNSETRIVDCVSCGVEGGDETNPEGWIRDAFGLTFPPTETSHLLYEGFITF